LLLFCSFIIAGIFRFFRDDITKRKSDPASPPDRWYVFLQCRGGNELMVLRDLQAPGLGMADDIPSDTNTDWDSY